MTQHIFDRCIEDHQAVIAAEIVGRFKRERKGLEAIALSTSGNSRNVVADIEVGD